MQYLAEPHQIERQILQLISTTQDSQVILSQIAIMLGNLFTVDACSIVSGGRESGEAIQTGSWYSKTFHKLETIRADCFSSIIVTSPGSIEDRETVDRVHRESSTTETQSDRHNRFVKAIRPNVLSHTEGDCSEFSCEPSSIKECDVNVINIPNQLNISILEPLAIEDLQTYKFNSQDSWLKETLPVTSLLAISTQFQGIFNGTILLGKSQAYNWTNSEKELLKILSESVAIAISQMQLQQQAQTRGRYQALLRDLSGAIGQNLDIDSTLRLAVRGTAKALQVDRSSIVMLKYKDPLFQSKNPHKLPKAKAQIACSWDERQDLVESTLNQYSFELSQSDFCQEAFKKAPQALAIPKQANFPDLESSHLPSNFASQSMEALLMMPLIGNSNNENKAPLVLGFLVLQHSQPRLWLSEELEFINWITIQISTAIIHNQTLTQVQSIIEERTAKLRLTMDIKSKLQEKMHQKIEELKQLNQLKDDFLSSMSHELKTPLTTMRMAIEMLRKPDLTDVHRERYLNILEQEWNREYNLIKDLLTLQKFESDEFTFHPQELNINEIIDRLTQSFTAKWHSDKGISFQVNTSEPTLSICTDAESLQHILDELILNAGKYSDVDTTVDLSIKRQIIQQSHYIEISVSNYGAGIAAEEIPYIFDKFRRGKGVTDRAVPGTGLGLALVKYLVDNLDGKIQVSSTAIDDSSSFLTCFTVTIPQYSK